MIPSGSVYVASPLGFSIPTRLFYETELLAALTNAGLVVLDPWQLPPGANVHDPVDPMVIGEKNARMIEKAHVVLAVLDGTDVDSGTAAEIGYAAALGRPVVGYRTDIRQTGEAGAVVNLQVEYFIRVTGRSDHLVPRRSRGAAGWDLFGPSERRSCLSPARRSACPERSF